jgi:hypothetical protein
VKRQQVVTGHDDLDFNGSESVRGLLGWTPRRDIAAEHKADGLPVGMDARRTSNRPLGDPERVDQLVAARLPERGVEPEEAPLSAQCGNPFSIAGGKPGQDLRHDASE